MHPRKTTRALRQVETNHIALPTPGLLRDLQHNFFFIIPRFYENYQNLVPIIQVRIKYSSFFLITLRNKSNKTQVNPRIVSNGRISCQCLKIPGTTLAKEEPLKLNPKSVLI